MLKRALFAIVALVCGLSLSAASQYQNYPFSIETEKEGNGHRIVARNNGPAPVSVRVSITDTQNISPDRPFPVFAVVPPGGGTLYLARIRPAMSSAGYVFHTQSSWVLGDFNARQSPDAIYPLPYRDGLAFHIGQSAGGPITTHTSPGSQYAVDIGMPEGTPIVAARDGVVIYTEANQTYGGQSPDLLSKANEVRIQHVDGTIAVYAHLAHGGVYVYPGQRVAAGAQIGLAGSTGYSTGPHLHFVVQTVERTANGLRTVSLPFQFYVGEPAVTFSPRFGMLASAEYSSAVEAPQIVAPVQRASRSSQAAQAPVATGSSELVMSFQVPPGVRSWLASIPAWQWAVGMISLIVLLVFLDEVYQARRRKRVWTTHEPTMRSRPSEEPPRHGLSSNDRLILACGGDRRRAERLQEYEYQRSPGITSEEAAQRAWERLQRDRT